MISYKLKQTWLLILLLGSGIAFSACAQKNDSLREKDISLKVEGSFFIQQNNYSSYDLSKGLYHNSEIIFLANIELPKELQDMCKSVRSYPRIYLGAIQGNLISNTGIRMSEISDLKKIHQYKAVLNKTKLNKFNFKLNNSIIDAQGWFELPEDPTKYPISFHFTLDSTHCNDFIRLASGETEEQLGVKIDKSILRGLYVDLNHPDFDKYSTQLNQYPRLETLDLHGKFNKSIPPILYNLESLDSISITKQYEYDNDQLSAKLTDPEPIIFPIKFLENSSVRVLSIACANAKIIFEEDFPVNKQIKALYIKNYQLDSFPQSVLNLSNLEILSCTYGQIKYHVPTNLKKLESLRVLKICLPYGKLPMGFGPWNELNELFIFPYIHNSRFIMCSNEDLDIILNRIKAETIYVNGEYH